jgi:hypothetical protein
MDSRSGLLEAASFASEVYGVDVILPCQYFSVCGGNRMSGEQRLLLALLADAINVYQKGVFSRLARDRLLYVDAERWFMQSRTAGNAFSFEAVCEALGIDARALRRRMIAWKHQVRHELQRERRPSLRVKTTPRRQSLTAPQRRSAEVRAV